MILNDINLIQRLRAKHSEKDTSGFNVLDFVGAFGSVLDALMYSRLFWPEFIEIDGMVFLKDNTDDHEDRSRVEKVLNDYGGDRSQTEKSFNLTEIPSVIFGQGIGESTEEEDEILAALLCEMWSARLKAVYPSRHFKVEVWQPEVTGGEIAIVFFSQPE